MILLVRLELLDKTLFEFDFGCIFININKSAVIDKRLPPLKSSLPEPRNEFEKEAILSKTHT